jgi:glycosyltransferase involved in cell wall biosynthesis
LTEIGLVGYALNRKARGIGRYTGELASALRAQGLLLLLLKAGDTRNEYRGLNLPGAHLLPGLCTLGQVEIAWHANRHDLELVHDPTGTAPLLLTPQKRIVTVHDAIPYLFPGMSTLLDWIIYHYWLPHAVQHIDQILTVSCNSKSDIAKWLGAAMKNITVIPLAAGKQFQPLDEQEVKPVLDRLGIQFPYILFIGSLEPRKNLKRLLEAYTLLLSWSSKRHLVVVGARNTWKSEQLGTYVEDHHLKALVHFTGYILDDDLPALYNGADLFVFPSLYEGFGLPVLEAMACGTPVITSNVSSLPEVAGDAALLVDPYNVEDIAAAVRHVLSDAELAADLRARGLERAQKFTWQETAAQTIAVYEQVLGRKLL